jgi:hypothetical protein
MSINKSAVYIFLILIYLAIAKSSSHNELGAFYVNSIDDIEQLVPGAPVSVILTDMHTTGFLIKSHYQKWRVVHGYRSSEEIIVQSSPKFTLQHKLFVGMEIFRRSSENFISNSTPLPPGSIFVDDPAFGRWREDNGIKSWRFYRAYRHLPSSLGWGDFRPNADFARQIQIHIEQNKPFYGFENEFGTSGKFTQKAFPDFFSKNRQRTNSLAKMFKSYFNYQFEQEI